MEGPAVKRFVTAPSISWSMLTSEYLSGRHGRFPEDAGARLTMERLRRRIRLICAGCSEEQSRMTPLRRELPPSSTTVSLNEQAADDRTPGKAGGAPGPRRGVDTSSRWRPARAVQDARGAPRGVKRLGTRAGWRKASGSGGKCASRSAARNAYAAMQSVA